MKHRLGEGFVMFSSITKWFVLATVVGAISGLSVGLFLKALDWIVRLDKIHPNYFYLLPLGLFISILLTKYFAPSAEGHGTEKVIEAVHKSFGKIKLIVIPVKALATLITLGVGGSVGKEGPAAQIAAGLSSALADLFKFSKEDRRKLVICGISAGFAAVFGTPISGAIFGVEILIVGEISYSVLLPCLIAGITAYEITTSMGAHYFRYPISLSPVISEAFLLKVAVGGMFFGLCSIFLIESIKYFAALSAKIKVWSPIKGLIGGSALVGLTLVFSEKYLGLGLQTIQSSLQGGKEPWYAFLVKGLFTSITLAFGGSGGVVTPIFFVGATAGNAFATITGLDAATFSAIGLVAVLAGTTNAPIAASIMAIELFGAKIAPYAAVACVISFLMTGHRSIYPSQLLSMSKSRSIKVELGKEIHMAQPEIQVRPKSFLATYRRTVQRTRARQSEKRKHKDEG